MDSVKNLRNQIEFLKDLIKGLEQIKHGRIKNFECPKKKN